MGLFCGVGGENAGTVGYRLRHGRAGVREHLAASALILATLVGCGTQANMAATSQPTETLAIDSTAGLKGAFTRIHKAIFTHMDADKNGWLDEVEVGGRMTLKEFEKAPLTVKAGQVRYRDRILASPAGPLAAAAPDGASVR